MKPLSALTWAWLACFAFGVLVHVVKDWIFGQGVVVGDARALVYLAGVPVLVGLLVTPLLILAWMIRLVLWVVNSEFRRPGGPPFPKVPVSPPQRSFTLKLYRRL